MSKLEFYSLLQCYMTTVIINMLICYFKTHFILLSVFIFILDLIFFLWKLIHVPGFFDK